MSEDRPKEVSTYNEAGLQILRLDNKWKKIDLLFSKGNLEDIKYELDRVWDELVADANKLDSKKYPLLNRINRVRVSKSKNFSELYENLIIRIRFLKLLQQAAGKGGSYKEEDEEGFE